MNSGGLANDDEQLIYLHLTQGISMATKKQKIHAIIHAASLTAGGIGSGLAQIPGADMPILMALQTAMIVAIGAE